MPDQLNRHNCRRALEALRNGVPNGDAVRVMGCGQPHVIRKFTSQLAAVKGAADQGRQEPGLLIEGGFGTGKSHVLEHLEHQALASKFVCSRVVISKETPLYDPSKVFLAAMESAVVPGSRGQAVQEIALQLDPRSSRHGELYRWANSPESGLSNLFAATLLLHERLNNDPELVEEVAAFWAGQKLSVQRIRQGLQHANAAQAFTIRTVAGKLLNVQRFRFVARLILAAGYNGWVMLLDEAELVSRYSLLQRARSYAELARWLGRWDNEQYPGLTSVATITDDFASVVLKEKGDEDRAPARLREPTAAGYGKLAPKAEIGIKLINSESIRLKVPNEEGLLQTYERLRLIHLTAYDWDPPDIRGRDLGAPGRTIRAHVKRWINEWDILRLYPGEVPDTEETTLKVSYEEDEAMEDTSATDIEDEVA